MVVVATHFQRKPLEFPSIVEQAKKIAFAYKVVGLYSTVLLTIVTVVSMTNVFTSGAFARFGWIPGVWAFIFAATIDLNIVRMFVEAAIERSQRTRGAWVPFCIGLGLSIVTGAALFIEGLQQSIGLNWHDATIQTVIAVLIGCRVLFVIVLMAREGTKLGVLLANVLSQPVHTAEKEEANHEEITVLPAAQDRRETHVEPARPRTADAPTEPLAAPPCVSVSPVSVAVHVQPEPPQRVSEPLSVNMREVVLNTEQNTTKKQQVKVYLSEHPNASIAAIMAGLDAKGVKVSKSYVSGVRSEP